jgi:hypothetical protein
MMVEHFKGTIAGQGDHETGWSFLTAMQRAYYVSLLSGNDQAACHKSAHLHCISTYRKEAL